MVVLLSEFYKPGLRIFRTGRLRFLSPEYHLRGNWAVLKEECQGAQVDICQLLELNEPRFSLAVLKLRKCRNANARPLLNSLEREVERGASQFQPVSQWHSSVTPMQNRCYFAIY